MPNQILIVTPNLWQFFGLKFRKVNRYDYQSISLIKRQQRQQKNNKNKKTKKKKKKKKQ